MPKLQQSFLLEGNHHELVISIEVSPNYELESALLAFGEKVKVLEPESFRTLIAGRLKAAVRMY